MNLNPISQEWRCRHAVADMVLGGFAAVVIAAVLISFIPPAWAVSFPVGNLFVIDLGDLPPWIGALVALAIWWDARKAKKNAAAAAALAGSANKKIETVSTQIDGLLAERDKAKVKEGEAKGKQAGADTAATLAEGQRQGMETERASVAAQGTTASAAPATGGSKQPLPVADDKNTKAGERVAEATERMAEAQQRVADAAEVKADKETKTGE